MENREVKAILKGSVNPQSVPFISLQEGDQFFASGGMHTVGTTPHYSGDASYDGYLLYDTDGDSWFPEDLDTLDGPDRFIRINGQDFSFDDLARALQIKREGDDPFQISLCQRVDDGILIAKASPCDYDEYPCIDVELELPEEKASLPVMLTRTEQPRRELEEEDHHVRNFCFSREDEYFAYFDADIRSDEEVHLCFNNPSIILSGNYGKPVEFYTENPHVKNCGVITNYVFDQKHSLENQIQTAEAKAAVTKSVGEKPSPEQQK